MGARLRLKPSTNLSRYSTMAQNIFRAMQTHGLIVADNGSDLYVTGAMDSRWNNSDLNPAFSSLTGADFECTAGCGSSGRGCRVRKDGERITRDGTRTD